MSWMNSDGLYVKFSKEEAAGARGGQYAETDQGRHVVDFTIDWKDCLSATAAILGSVATVAEPITGARGIVLPAGFIPEFLETVTAVAWTSSGTIGTADLEIGLKKASDRSTVYDADAFTTTSFVGGVFDAANETTLVKSGTTGVGSAFGIALTEDAVITVRNSGHASHPYTAGVLKCRLVGRFGLASV